MLEKITIEPPEPADACVIWLHGLGASGEDFSRLLPYLQLPPNHRIRFIFPHAPIRAITINQGMKMPGWYDITSLDRDPTHQDISGILESRQAINVLIEQACQEGISPERIVIAGFSQGGVIALLTALCYPKKLCGVIALSTYLAAITVLETERTAQNQTTPILMVHGTQDDVVAYPLAKYAKQKLTQLGYTLKWHEYPMRHEVCPEEVAVLRTTLIDWLVTLK